MIGSVRPYYGPVTVVAAWHFIQGISVAAEPHTTFISAVAGLPSKYAAICLISTAVFSIVARVSKNPLAWVLVIPQQAVLFLQAWGALNAVLLGQYPDGYTPIPDDLWSSRWFILGDQILIIILGVWHTVEMTLMAWHTIYDKEVADEVLELRRRVASYEEAGKWEQLIEDMSFFNPDHRNRQK